MYRSKRDRGVVLQLEGNAVVSYNSEISGLCYGIDMLFGQDEGCDIVEAWNMDSFPLIVAVV